MVKLYCNRCNAEIKDKYYEIYIHEHDINSKSSCSEAAVSAFTNTFARKSILEELNSEVMFCEKCKNKIVNCIGGI